MGGEGRSRRTVSRLAQPPPNWTRLRAALGGYDSFLRYPKADPGELRFGNAAALPL